MSTVSTPATSASPEPVKSNESYVFQNTIHKQNRHAIKGDGVRITVEDPETGKTSVLLDAMTGAAVGALGWGDKDVEQFIIDAAKTCNYSYPVYIGNKNAEDLAELYIKNSYPGAFSSALFVGSGSEANENALKIMYQYWIERGQPKKTKFISRSISYHGFSVGTFSISGNPRANAFRAICVPETQCLKTDPCFPFRFQKEGQTLDEYTDMLLNNLEDLIKREGADTIAGIILETLPGSSIGTAPPPPNYLKGVREICNKYDILFHLDEVMCGTGRCNPNGKLNCWENFLAPGEGPDIQTVGKTLGSGYVTIAGVLVSPKVKQAYVEGSGMVSGSHTYASHSFNCYVACKIQEKILSQGLTKNIWEMGNLMGKRLQEELLPNNEMVVDVRGMGGFWSIEFAKLKETKECFPKAAGVGVRVQNKSISNGLTIMGGAGVTGDLGDIALLAPSFIITKDDVDEIVRLTIKSVNEVTEDLKREGYL